MARSTVKFINPWAKKVEEATKGRVKITMYPAESLARATESLEATRSGLADFTWTLLGYYPGRFNLSRVMELPFLCLPSGTIDGKPVSAGQVNSRIMQELYDTTPEIQAEFNDVKFLFINSTGVNVPISTKKPIRNQADVKGKKIRELGGYSSEMWKLLGASPMLIGAPEVSQAAEKGVIDMTVQPWAAIATWKYWEVFHYWTNVPLRTASFVMIMNLDTWKSLPPDIQQAIMSVSGTAGADFAGQSAFGFDEQADAFALMEKAGFKMEKVELDAGEEQKWKDIGAKPLWDKWVEEMKSKGLPGQRVLDAALKLMDKYK